MSKILIRNQHYSTISFDREEFIRKMKNSREYKILSTQVQLLIWENNELKEEIEKLKRLVNEKI